MELLGKIACGRLLICVGVQAVATGPYGLRCLSDELTVRIPLLLSAPMVVLIPPLVPSSQPRSSQRAYDADEATDCRSC